MVSDAGTPTNRKPPASVINSINIVVAQTMGAPKKIGMANIKAAIINAMLASSGTPIAIPIARSPWKASMAKPPKDERPRVATTPNIKNAIVEAVGTPTSISPKKAEKVITTALTRVKDTAPSITRIKAITEKINIPETFNARAPTTEKTPAII